MCVCVCVCVREVTYLHNDLYQLSDFLRVVKGHRYCKHCTMDHSPFCRWNDPLEIEESRGEGEGHSYLQATVNV